MYYPPPVTPKSETSKFQKKLFYKTYIRHVIGVERDFSRKEWEAPYKCRPRFDRYYTIVPAGPTYVIIRENNAEMLYGGNHTTTTPT